MAQKRGTNTRRASESSGSSAAAKKQKPSPTQGTSSASLMEKRRPSALKGSFKKGLHSPKRVSPPVAFSQSVNYDDGSQSNISKSPIIPPPSYQDSIRSKIKVSPSDSAQDEDATATSSIVQGSDLQISNRANNTRRFANLTPPPNPGKPKKNPLYLPPETGKTVPQATSKPAFPEMSTAATPKKKIAVGESIPEHLSNYEPYQPLPKHDSSKSGLKVLEELVGEPHTLKLEEVSDALIALRDQVRGFSTKHFDYEMTCHEKRDWPLADLQDECPEFVANCAYIADGSQYGWRQLFTESHSRPQLVNGLLAHYLIEHVFKHTCFGFNEKELADLEDNVLKKYIHYDGFVRSKQLGLGISEILHRKPVEDRAFDTFVAVKTLTTRILSTIAPLMRSGTDAQAGAEVETTLNHILTHTQALALSIRLTGTNRTIFRFSFPTKNSEYQLDGGQNCLNSARVDATAHHAPDHDRDELRVKIPCWPTVIATVPSGPDMLDFKHDPSLKQRTGKPLPTYTGAPQDNPGAFVTEVFMTPADVSCEWTPLAAPLQYPQKLTLWQAIQHAKKERALALGQPWPPAAPWRRNAAHTAGYVLVGTVAAVTACTPSGRRLLLDNLKRAADYIYPNDSDNDTTATTATNDTTTMKQIIDDAAASLTSKESFFSRLGKMATLPTRGFTLNNLTLNCLLLGSGSGRITKPRTITKRTIISEMRGPSRKTTAGVYDWLPIKATRPSSSSSTSPRGFRFPFTRGVATGLGRKTTRAIAQPTATQQ